MYIINIFLLKFNHQNIFLYIFVYYYLIIISQFNRIVQETIIELGFSILGSKA